MDHVGVGRPVNGDSIYNGADDDASGTTGLLEVAEAFARMGVRPRRSIVFLHVSGEEKGLLGSAWYAEHPTVPLAQTVANVNVDMIGRNDPGWWWSSARTTRAWVPWPTGGRSAPRPAAAPF
jgi:Zn-dependent M28 family amino/carboxypeptidase